MAQYGFQQFGGGGQNTGSGSIDPNDLAMGGAHGSSYSNNFSGGSNNFTNGSALFGDEELLDTLSENPPNVPNQGQDFGAMGDMNMAFSQPIYTGQMNGYSNTPEGDPISSPFVHSYNNQQQFQQMQQGFRNPIAFSGSPFNGNDGSNDADGGYMKNRMRLAQAQAMQRKPSNTRSPLTPNAAMASLTVGSHDSPGFGAQPIRAPAAHHEKSPSAQWINTPKSLSSFPGSGLSSPMQHGFHHQNPQVTEVMRNAGTSMPARLGAGNAQAQDLKRKKRRESHNLVERRRRDNINERIQDLSRLVPMHRLEDEKIKKLLQNGTQLSPNLSAIPSPGQATSGLAGPGAKRASGAGNITTGLPIEEKDKGPNMGDILNGAVSWTRDLMWMLHLKLQQQEELINAITELGGSIPFELTEDEKRMQTELMEAMSNNKAHLFGYSRSDGTGLRVPHHTDYKGDPLNGSAIEDSSVSPDDNENAIDLTADLDSADQFLVNDFEEDDKEFKEEDEYMDLGA